MRGNRSNIVSSRVQKGSKFRSNRPGWGSFESVELPTIERTNEGCYDHSGVPDNAHSHSTLQQYAEYYRKKASQWPASPAYGDSSQTGKPGGPAIELTKKNTMTIPSNKTEETYFNSNRWVIHEQSPFYKRFLDKTLSTRTPRINSLGSVTTSNSSSVSTRKVSSKVNYAWNTWAALPRNRMRSVDLKKSSTHAEYHSHEGIYADEFNGFMRDSHKGMAQFPVSLYTTQRLEPEGMHQIRNFLTPAEERDILAEIMSTTLHRDRQSPTRYVSSEGRYCTNYFDEELSVPNRCVLAWGTARLPLLGRVLLRAYRLGLLPSMPNTFQINEYVTPYSGYAWHRKHPSLGPYIGILSLISAQILRLSHHSELWYPRVYLEPRGLCVLQGSARYDYLMSTSPIGQGAHGKAHNDPSVTRINFTRHTKDYRVEVMFASVDSKNLPALDIAQKITDYSRQEKLLPE